MYQLIIIGAGPAGLSAGIYAQRYGIQFLVIGQLIGGTLNEAHLVENYPGFKSISGSQLAKLFQKHLAAKIKQEQVEKITKENSAQGPIFTITTNKGKYQAQSLVISLGMKIRKLEIKGEDKFLDKGIAYYTPGNLSQFKNKTLAVVGGGDSALMAALKVADQAKKVYLIHRRDEFRGAPILIKRAKERPNIEIIYQAKVSQAQGKKVLEKIVLDNKKEIKLNQLFIEIGGIPNVHLVKNLNLKMENNFIITDKNQMTNLAGVFAAGDITNNPLKQIVTASAEGAIAATSAYHYLKRLTE